MDIILLPFRITWGLFSLLLNLTGRILGIVIGIVFMAVGLILTVTFIGSVLGIPLLILGLLLIIRSLFK
ncbi:MAG: hypothetical protein FWE20_00940 [Defluviitaleaceae bacterium]|nr:hypothetical protein [Defluviitaleaceae bacterium]